VLEKRTFAAELGSLGRGARSERFLELIFKIRNQIFFAVFQIMWTWTEDESHFVSGWE
jgi:hypothetical protein